MLLHEFRKHLTRPLILVTAALLLLHLSVLLVADWDYFSAAGQERQAIRREMLHLHKTDPEAYRAVHDLWHQEASARETALTSWMFTEAPLPVVVDRYTGHIPGDSDSDLFMDTEQAIHRTEAFARDINGLLYEAYTGLSDGTAAEGSYLYDYYINLILTYEPLRELTLPTVYMEGWNRLISAETPTLFLFITLVFAVSGVFTMENRTGFTSIWRTTKRKHRLIRTKYLTVFLASALLTLLFTLSSLLLYLPGLTGAGAPAQCLDSFRFCPYPVTVGQLFLLLTLTRTIFFGLIGLFLAGFGWLIGTPGASAVLALGLMQFPQVVLTGNKFNLRDVLHGTLLFDRYRSINLAELCIPLWALLLSTAAVLMLSVNLAAYFLRIRQRISRFSSGRKGTSSAWSTGYYGILRNEGHKALTLPWVVLFLVFLVAEAVVLYANFTTNFTGDEWSYRKYAERFTGTVAEIQAMVEEEETYLNNAVLQYEQAKEAYKSGEISQEDYTTAQNRNSYAESNTRGFSRFLKWYNYLSNQEEKAENIRVYYDTGLRKLIFRGPDLLLILAVTLFTQQICTVENPKFLPILRCTKKGRRETYNKKFTLALLISTGFFLLFTGEELLLLRLTSNFTAWDAAIQTIEQFETIHSPMTIASYLAIHSAAAYLGTLFYTAIVFSVALLTRNLFLTAAASLAYFLPTILTAMGLPMFGDTALTLASPTPWTTWGYTLFTGLLAAALLHVSYRHWNHGYPLSDPSAFTKWIRRRALPDANVPKSESTSF